MKQNRLTKTKAECIAKFIVYCIITLLVGFGAYITPKEFFSRKTTYSIVLDAVDLSDDNLVFSEYKVYATETRFEEGLNVEAKEIAQKYLESGDVLVLKVPEGIKCENGDTYIVVNDPNVYELNIEFYVAKNVQLATYSLPASTVINLIEEISRLINTIYLIVISIVGVILLAWTIPNIVYYLDALIKKDFVKNQAKD